MKLKTEMQPIVAGSGMWPVIRRDCMEPGDMSHDAAAAHALMQAIEEFWESPDGGGHEFDGVRCVQERADELMREWGFES